MSKRQDELKAEIRVWFSPEDYMHRAPSILPAWYLELYTRKIMFESLCSSDRSEFDPKEVWEYYRGESRQAPAGFKIDETGDDEPYVPLWDEAVSEIKIEPKQIDTRKLYKEGQRLLRIDPNAPDTAIRAGFVQWLAALRTERPLPVKRQGHGETNVKITGSMTARWKSKKVLAVADIEFWMKLFHPDKNLSYEALCELINGDDFDGDAKDWGRKARAARKQAFKSIGLLPFQTID